MGQGKYLVTFSFFSYRQGITKQVIQIQERSSMRFSAWFHHWSVSKLNLFIPYLMQPIKNEERRFSPVYYNNQLIAFLLISGTQYLPQHSNAIVAHSQPERCLKDHYSILQGSSICLPATNIGLWSCNFVKWLSLIRLKAKFIFLYYKMSLPTSRNHSECHAAWQWARTPSKIICKPPPISYLWQ